MPISNYRAPSMRMNVSQLLLHELAVNTTCNFNPEKKEIKEISKDSMQCLMKTLNEKEIVKEETKVVQTEEGIQPVPATAAVARIRRNFIPYPDHNYGQQPPLTPPAEDGQLLQSVKSEINVHVKQRSGDKETEDNSGITRCICGFGHDDGYMICCDNCSSWQHIECMGINSSKVPEKYSCHRCNPRELDIEKAVTIQAKKKENMSEVDEEDEEETASEDEAPNKTVYTAISNTPTRITLFSNIGQATQPEVKTRSKRGSRVQKRKLSDQRNTRRKSRRKERVDLSLVGSEDFVPFHDSNSLSLFLSAHQSYEEIEENRYDNDLKAIYLNHPEVIPKIDFSKAIKFHTVSDVTSTRKGLVAVCSVPSGACILEYKGDVLLQNKFNELTPIFNRSCPYLVHYSKIENLPLVVDARAHGNDARFARHSCSSNAEFQHVTANGLIRIMIISKVDILKDKEITVPFDFPLSSYTGYVECACDINSCVFKSHNEEWRQANEHLEEAAPVPVPINENSKHELIMATTEQQHESEAELNAGTDDSKHEKLSREERKLQAYLKQFEKLEKKQDTVKKVKEPKTPVAKVADENPTIVNSAQKAVVAKKLSTSKRKISMSGKRRTRQSSCSSEPVSPAELETSSSTSTPTTPLNLSLSQMQFENARQKNRKEKEPLTLTLPIQRKLKHDHPMTSPTPPSTPLAANTPLTQLSPALGSDQQFPLSVDTHTHSQFGADESAPIKPGLSNGLLQIVQNRSTSLPVTPVLSTFGVSTAEEKIGDLTTRFQENAYPSSPIPRLSFNRQAENIGHQKYYGSLKKHWLRQHANINTNFSRTNGNLNGVRPVTLAALVATLSQQRHLEKSSPANNHFKRPQGCVPLKKRHLLRASLKQSAVDDHKIINDGINNMLKEMPQATLVNDRNTCVNKLPDTTNKTIIVIPKEEPLFNSNIQDNVSLIRQDNGILLVKQDNSLINNSLNERNEVTETRPVRNEVTETQRVRNEVTETQPVRNEVTETQPVRNKVTETLPVSNQDMKLENIKFNDDRPAVTQSVLEPRSMNINDKSNIPVDSNVNKNLFLDNKDIILLDGDAKSTIPSEDNKQLLLDNRDKVSNKLDDGDNTINNNINNRLLNDNTCSKRLSDEIDKTSDPAVKRYRSNSTEDSDSELQIVIPENILSSTAYNINSHSMLDVKQLKLESNTSLTVDPKSISISPRSSVDSNPDIEHGGEQGSGGKKKLSFKEYQKRQQSQKTSVSSSSSSHPPLPADDTKPLPPLPSMPVPASPAQKIHQTASILLTPRTVSLRDDSSTSKKDDQGETTSFTMDTKQISPDTTKRLSQDKSQLQQERPQLIQERSQSSTSSVFEPVSPGNEYDSESPTEETGYSHSIHSEITKNPFTIHNDITKNPFGKKQNNQAPGLLQYLSAQKYPHLMTNLSGISNTHAIPHYRQAQQTPEFSVHSSESLENDDDTSSTHSNMSSTSYASSSDVLHDRSSYSNHYRTHTRGGDHRDLTSRDVYCPNQHSQHPSYYQNYNQQMQPPVPRTNQRNLSQHNNYPPTSTNQPSRQRQHRGYIPF